MAKVYEDYQESRVQVEGLDERVQYLEVKKQKLEKVVEGLDSDTLTPELENTIREELKQVKKGETIYRIELDKTE